MVYYICAIIFCTNVICTITLVSGEYMKNFLALLSISVGLMACSSSQVKPSTSDTTAATSKQPQTAVQQPETNKVQDNAIKSKQVEIDPLTDPSNILSKRNVYFDFDKYEVKPEYRALVEAHAKYLNDHSNRMVTIEGNADERGSREYNLALGQKRAVAVKQLMNLLGVKDNQIETISYGEEKPKDNGHDEAAWAENRRADIRYQGEMQ